MDFFLCNRLELLSSTSHYFGDPSVPLHSTPPPRPLLPLTSLHQNTLFSIGEQWNFYFATDPRLKLHGLYYHKLSILPPPPSPSKPPDPLLLDSRTRPSSSSPRLLHSTRSPAKTTTRRTPHLFSLLHLFTPTHAHRHFSLSLRHHSFPILPPTRAKHKSFSRPSLSLSLALSCPVPCRASDQEPSRRLD